MTQGSPAVSYGADAGATAASVSHLLACAAETNSPPTLS